MSTVLEDLRSLSGRIELSLSGGEVAPVRRSTRCPRCKQNTGTFFCRHIHGGAVYHCADTGCGHVWTGDHPEPLPVVPRGHR